MRNMNEFWNRAIDQREVHGNLNTVLYSVAFDSVDLELCTRF